MSDAEVPEADAVEQAAPVEAEPGPDAGGAGTTDLEAPEADALEQSEVVERGGGAAPPEIGLEVPAADAQEQALVVGDEDDRR
jgi:hypothetical protein